MRINNNFNVLPWYDSISRQNSKKWYSFGQHYPLICPDNSILPFQFVVDTQIEITGNIKAVSVESGNVIDLEIRPSVTLGTQTDANYYIVKQGVASIPELPVGLYYFTLSTSAGVLYSEEVVVVDNLIDYVKIEYWNESTLNFTNGEIDFSDDFRFNLYMNTTIGKPEYQFEEELTKRLGYKFIESQTSNKLYRFNFLAPEYLCDSMRLVRLCDYIKISTKDDSYNALTFSYEPKWQEQGDLAAVECEFETDCIIQKLESFNRRLKESFYNALLHELDEPILFSTDTIAQYYNEFTTTALVNGKLIRQLDAMQVVELRDNTPNIFLPVDNISDNSQKAKKLSISDLLTLSNISDISKLFKGHFDENGNLLWIEALSHIGVNGGVTMFIDNGTMSLPQLYFGLPIDGKTLIRDDNGVLMINPDIDLGGGVSTWDELTGKPSWITDTKPKYSYSEIEGTPDLSAYVTSTALSNALAKYVTLGGDETISGLKDFTKGLKISGLGISKSQDDVIYIDANLVVRGGITMYAEGSVDIPSILDSLPVASTTAKGIASFDSSYFSVDSDGKVTLLAENVGLNESELATYLSNNGYATQNWVNSKGYALSADLNALQTKVNYFLEGSDTDTIINKWLELEAFLSGLTESDNLATILSDKANKATTLAGYGITDAYTSAKVDELLGLYVTLGTAQTITGEKNFTGGLKVNGSPIVYDATNKYWKLEGDLLVTGGVTMYANEGTYTPSTIMDALLLDSDTLGINDEGRLYVKGGAGGGLTEVYWNDVKGKPTFATVATSGKYSDLSGTPTLLSSFTNDVGFITSYTDTKNTAGSTNTSSKIFLIGATSQAANPQTYSHDTAYVGTDGYLYSGGAKVLTAHQTIYNLTMQAGTFSAKTFDPNGAAITVNIPTSTSHISEGSNLYFTNARAVSALASTLSGYLPLSGGTMEGDIFLPIGKYIKNPSTTYAILGVGTDNTVICGEPKNLLHLRGTQVNIPQKTFIEGDGANVLTLKRNNTAGGAFCFYKAMNQDALGWIAGTDSAHEFIFNYTSDGLSTNTNLLRLTTEGHLFNKGNVIIGSVEKTNNVVALNVLGKGWFSSGVKLKNETSSYNTNGITFSSTVGGSILGRIGGDTSGNIGVFPTGIFAVRPGYTGTGTAYGLTVDGRGSVGIDFTTNQVGLWLRQKSNNLAWMAYAPSNQTTNVWLIGAETDNVFRMRYSSDGLSTTPATKFALNTNGLLSTVMGLQVNGASVISTTTPSIALPFSSYISFGGYHALRGETNAVVLCAPVSASGTVILRPNGNASTKYQFSINNLGEAVLSSESAASLTINRTATTGGAYTRYNAAGQTTYGWISGSGPNHTYQCQYFNGSGYYIKSELDSNGNFLAYGGITMYSDIRKKTKLKDVELSLKQIADAPLIEHYYNSDDKRTTHVGSIAQYWAGLNDWFCKLDGEGFYTMEIQNAALASAISIARELSRYETETDRKIRELKNKIKQLECKINQLKAA